MARWVTGCVVLAASMLIFLPMPTRAASITLKPAASLSGAPGATIGWGYTIVADADRDLSFSFIDADPILATDGSLSFFVFDFPVVAAGASLQTDYDPSLSRGLFELMLGPTLAPGQVVSGRLFGEFLLIDPTGLLPDRVAAFELPFSASVTASSIAVPEPSTLILFGTALLALGGVLRPRIRAIAAHRGRTAEEVGDIADSPLAGRRMHALGLRHTTQPVATGRGTHRHGA